MLGRGCWGEGDSVSIPFVSQWCTLLLSSYKFLSSALDGEGWLTSNAVSLSLLALLLVIHHITATN